jgi:hypothetical protein
VLRKAVLFTQRLTPLLLAEPGARLRRRRWRGAPYRRVGHLDAALLFIARSLGLLLLARGRGGRVVAAVPADCAARRLLLLPLLVVVSVA